MPLKIHLRQGQRVIINGAVLENATPRNVSLLAMNGAAILRDTDILTPEEASTPASRAYYSLQCLYLFPDEKVANIERAHLYLREYMAAAPSSEPVIDEIKSFLADEKFYNALKEGQKLIEHERKVLDDVHQRLGQEVRHGSDGR